MKRKMSWRRFSLRAMFFVTFTAAVFFAGYRTGLYQKEQKKSQKEWEELLVLAEAAKPRPFVSTLTTEVVDVFGSEEAINVVKYADKISCYRLEQGSDETRLDRYLSRGDSVDDFEILSGPLTASPEVINELRDALLDASSYPPPNPGGGICVADYDVRVRFENQSKTVDVLIGLSCELVLVYHDGVRVSTTRFDAGYPAILHAAKEMFPNDPELQSLN